MDAKTRALMWEQLRRLQAHARHYLGPPGAPELQPLALGLLQSSHILEVLLLEHGPEIDLLGRTVVRDEQGKVTERALRSLDSERDEPEI
jgi:hypothetical protein